MIDISGVVAEIGETGYAVVLIVLVGLAVLYGALAVRATNDD